MSRFIPGETLSDAVEALGRLEAAGLSTVLTYLGENVVERDGALEVEGEYTAALDALSEGGLATELSVKPTQLGLDLSPELCRELSSRLAEASDRRGRTLWIDMEQSSYVDATLELYRKLREEGRPAGICLQAYLWRTPDDLADLLPLDPAVRLVKGAYREPPETALRGKDEVRSRFRELGRRLLEERADGRALRPAFATHDQGLIRDLRADARKLGLAPGSYEFQMLYGIRGDLARRLALEGERVGILLSYGEAWYPWYMRRLAERPANLLFLLRGLVPGGSSERPLEE